jgi:subtilase family serine protease
LAKVSSGVALAAALVALPLLSASPASAALVRPGGLAPGSAPAGASALGSVPTTQVLNISVVLPPQNQSALSNLLREQTDPSSPEFHHWLSSSQYQSEFGPAPSAAAAVSSWLRSDGFSPTTSGYTVKFTAPEAAVASALGTSFERYRLADGHNGYFDPGPQHRLRVHLFL